MVKRSKHTTRLLYCIMQYEIEDLNSTGNFMEKIELEVLYQVSDWVNAALAYFSAMGDFKKRLEWNWVFTIIMFSYVLALFLSGSLIFVLCPFGSACANNVLLPTGKVVLLVTVVFGLILINTYTHALYKWELRWRYRRTFARQKNLSQPWKIIIDEEGVVIDEITDKVIIYWKSFQKIIESNESFLLSQNKNRYVVIPKRAFHDQQIMTVFREIVIAKTNEQIILETKY